jgi:hypothetical protein
MIPAEVLSESREKAQGLMRQSQPVNRSAAAAIVLIWLLLAAGLVLLIAKD